MCWQFLVLLDYSNCPDLLHVISSFVFSFSNMISLLQGSHGDLTSDESQILLAEFFLRHSKSAISTACEYAIRKSSSTMSKLWCITLYNRPYFIRLYMMWNLQQAFTVLLSLLSFGINCLLQNLQEYGKSVLPRVTLQLDNMKACLMF